MNKKKIMAMPAICFWAVAAVCLLGIVIGSVCDFRINEALANKTDLGAFFATYGSYFSYCLYPAAGACLFVGLRKKGSRYEPLAWTLMAIGWFLAVYYSNSYNGRIDSNNAADTERQILSILAEHPGVEPAFDAAALEYISSAGLRVLMKVRKQVRKAVDVVNVSPEVYDIFETTGFTDLLNVQKALRQISIEGCEKIGQGGNGTVYRLDEDKIVKVFKPWMDLKDIDQERSFARNAFVNGVPSVIAYDVVKVPTDEGECLGVVFEMLRSDTLGHAFMSHPEQMMEYLDKYVELAKTIHTTHVAPGTFTELREVYHSRVANLKQWCSQEEMDLLDRLVDSIPDSDTLTHNDLHPGNIMLQDGELVLIDMQEVTIAPPVCDLVSIYRDMIVAPQSAPELMEMSTGMKCEMIGKVGYLFFQKYTGITDPAALEEYFKKLGLLYAFNVVLVAGSGNDRATKSAPIVMDRLLRGVVIPNQQAISYLFRTL